MSHDLRCFRALRIGYNGVNYAVGPSQPQSQVSHMDEPDRLAINRRYWTIAAFGEVIVMLFIVSSVAKTQMKSMMTIEGPARYLSLSKSSSYKLCQQSKIPGQKVGRHRQFHKAAVDC